MNAENVHQDTDLAAPDLPREPEDAAGSAAADSDAGTGFDTEAGALIEPAAEPESDRTRRTRIRARTCSCGPAHRHDVR